MKEAGRDKCDALIAGAMLEVLIWQWFTAWAGPVQILNVAPRRAGAARVGGVRGKGDCPNVPCRAILVHGRRRARRAGEGERGTLMGAHLH